MEVTKDFWSNRGAKYSFHTAGAPMDDSDFSNELRAQYRTNTEIKHIQRKINLKDKTILDLGCGTGRLAVRFAKYCKRVVAVDFAEGMIANGRKFVEDNGVTNVEFICSHVNEFSTNEKFDIIHLGGVLMYLDDSLFSDLLTNILSFSHHDTVIISRDTISLNSSKTSKDFEGHREMSWYRNIEDYNMLFRDKFETLYFSEVYPIVIPLNLYYRLPKSFQKNKLVLLFLKLGLILQANIIDPFLLNNKGLYSKVAAKWQTRQYYFFHKLRTIYND